MYIYTVILFVKYYKNTIILRNDKQLFLPNMLWLKHVGKNKVNKIHYKNSSAFCWLFIFYGSD